MKNKGIPKQDGTGRGTRANKGRGGCPEPRTIGRFHRIVKSIKTRRRRNWFERLFNK